MRINYNGMTIFVKDNYESMSKKAAALVAAQVTLKADSVLGLATGSTPEGMYQALVQMYLQDEVDFSEAISFNLDEYYPIDASNPQSYHYYMEEKFFKHVNFKEGNNHLPDGKALDVEEACKAYDEAIYEHGIDLQVLGIGNNGHIGFNEPDVHFESSTHLVKLDVGTIEANARFFETIEEVPTRAVSMGIKNIMHAKKIILIASGEAKADIIEAMIFGDITPKVPASILQLHNDVTMILDQAAAGKILAKLMAA